MWSSSASGESFSGTATYFIMHTLQGCGHHAWIGHWRADAK